MNSSKTSFVFEILRVYCYSSNGIALRGHAR
jgi:hypothetical protein